MSAWIPGFILGLLSLIVTLSIFLSNRAQAKEQVQLKAFDALSEDVQQLKLGQAEINVKLGIFWKDVSFDAAKILHRPHQDAAQMDALIDKYLSEQINGEELKRFIVMLEKTRDDGTLLEGRRLAASQMLRAIKQRYELMEIKAAVKEVAAGYGVTKYEEERG